MYESFFGFEDKPFSLLPDPDFLYLSRAHSEALTMLEYGLMNMAGFTVITGEIGCGKTTLIRALLDRIEVDVSVGLITNTHESFGDLMQWVLLAFGLEFKDMSKPEMYRLFTDFIIEQYAQNRRTVLIVDEAQNLNVAALEELRMLSNINVDKHQVLQLILVGQPQLRSSLVRPELTQFAQRIAVDYHIEALDERETKRYVRHRVRHAGGNPIVFRSAAYPAIYRFSRGVPRLINVLCDTSLVYAFGENKKRVSEEMIREVVRDRIKGVVFEDRPNKTQGFSYPGLASKLKGASGDSRVTPLASDQDRDLLRELFPDGTDGL